MKISDWWRGVPQPRRLTATEVHTGLAPQVLAPTPPRIVARVQLAASRTIYTFTFTDLGRARAFFEKATYDQKITTGFLHFVGDVAEASIAAPIFGVILITE